MAFPLLEVITGGISVIGNLFKGWQERKTLQAQAEVEIQRARTNAMIEMAKNAQQAEFNWDTLMAEGTKDSWKDEWFVLLLSIPAILCFIPGCDVYVYAGFKALQETPDWYKAAFGLAVAASFGYRKFAEYMQKRNGNGKPKEVEE